MKRTAEAGNDLFHACGTSDEKLAAAEDVLETLRVLYNSVAQSSRPQIEHMAALMHLSLAHFEMSGSKQASASEQGMC